MNFHTCKYCPGETEKISSNNNIIETADEVIMFPDIALHFIEKHNWLPPKFFIKTIINIPLKEAIKMRFRGRTEQKKLKRVGYLSGLFPEGKLSNKFAVQLRFIMFCCHRNGCCVQSKQLL